MNTATILKTACLAALLLVALIAATSSMAANECRIYYQYRTSSGSMSSALLNLDQGGLKSVGRAGVLYIQNKNNHPISVEITNLWPPYGKKWVTLSASGDQDPPIGSYTGNVTLHNAECGAQQGVATPEQLVTALKAAGVPIAEIAGQLASTFNQTGSQIASVLRQAGYGSGPVTLALVSSFGPTGAQVAGWLSDAGFAAADVGAALQQHFNATAQQAAQWLQQAGFALNDVARVLRNTFDLGAAAVVDALRSLYNASDAALTAALEFAGFTSTQIAEAMVGTIMIEQVFTGFTGGYHSIPNATPTMDFPLEPGANRITIRGRGLAAVTAINGLPAGSSVQVGQFGVGQAGPVGWDYRHVDISIPSIAPSGLKGVARLMVGRMEGPTFNWTVQVPERVVSREPPPPRPPGGGGAALPDLEPLPFVGTLYKVGSATTMDAEGDTFTALDPFQNSTFCQGIPQGTVTRDNSSTSNMQRITVPDIRWGVENSSSVDVTAPFTIRLMHGPQQVAIQNITGLPANQSSEFIYRRPNSQTTVARVGPGDGCYHVGLGTEGWSDNPGYSVEVDFGDDVSESSETNNRRSF